MSYEKPRCSHAQCNYEPVQKCKMCGALLCMQHAESYQSPNAGAAWRQYDGVYCDTHYNQIATAHNEQVQKENRSQKAGETADCACNAMKCGCDFLESICKSSF